MYAKRDAKAVPISEVTMLKYDELETEIGKMMVVADEMSLYLLEFQERSKLNRKFQFVEKKLKQRAVFGKNHLIMSIEKELKQYFKGTLKEFKTPVSFLGTPFQISVWKALQTIPFGKTIAYADLATLIGKPTAFRAAGNANGNNLMPIIVPCHRVINSNGHLGGYSSGLNRKEWLLNHEKATI